MPHDVLQCSHNTLQDKCFCWHLQMRCNTQSLLVMALQEILDGKLCRLQQASSVEIATAETKGQSQLLSASVLTGLANLDHCFVSACSCLCRQQQVSSTEAAKEETEKVAAAALEAVLAAVPRHRQDLTLLEALDKALDGAKRSSQKRFSESNAAAGVITADIAKLQQLLQPQVRPCMTSCSAIFMAWPFKWSLSICDVLLDPLCHSC